MEIPPESDPVIISDISVVYLLRTPNTDLIDIYTAPNPDPNTNRGNLDLLSFDICIEPMLSAIWAS